MEFEPIRLDAYVFESDRERELINAFKTIITYTPEPSEELDGGRFWSAEEISASIGKGVFTPNFEQEYLRLFASADYA